MKKVIFVVLLFLCIIGLTGCGIRKTTDPTEKELLPRPVSDDGRSIEIRDLKFYLPKKFVAKNTNGANGIFEYYTGDYVEFGPTGIDVYISYQATPEEFDLETYATKKSSGALAKAEMKKTTINEYEWYKGSVKEDYYYYGSTPEGVYDIHIHKNEDTLGIYQDTLDMFEKTLFIENRETK